MLRFVEISSNLLCMHASAPKLRSALICFVLLLVCHALLCSSILCWCNDSALLLTPRPWMLTGLFSALHAQAPIYFCSAFLCVCSALLWSTVLLSSDLLLLLPLLLLSLLLFGSAHLCFARLGWLIVLLRLRIPQADHSVVAHASTAAYTILCTALLFSNRLCSALLVSAALLFYTFALLQNELKNKF